MNIINYKAQFPLDNVRYENKYTKHSSVLLLRLVLIFITDVSMISTSIIFCLRMFKWGIRVIWVGYFRPIFISSKKQGLILINLKAVFCQFYIEEWWVIYWFIVGIVNCKFRISINICKQTFAYWGIFGPNVLIWSGKQQSIIKIFIKCFWLCPGTFLSG